MKYVYKHLDSKGKIFYIGCGKRARVYSRFSRSDKWKQKVKNGYTIEIIAILPKEEALKLEIKLQKETGMDNLVNERCGLEHSKETLKKIMLANTRARELKKKHLY